MSSTQSPLRIGTRGSRLAMWQAEHVRAQLAQHHPQQSLEIVQIQSLGDRDKSTPLAELGGVGVFTKELEDALTDDRCDIAVHSLKDVPTVLPEGFELAAVLEREDPRDALISRGNVKLADLPTGSVVGTSSLRRRSQLLHAHPELEMKNLRGNVPTRLRAVGVELDEGKAPKEHFDATLLAYAGVKRLGLAEHLTELLDPEVLIPAPAQGAVGIEIRAGDDRAAELVACLDHAETRRRVTAERTFLRTLEGGCRVPIGALAEIEGEAMLLRAVVGNNDGSKLFRGRLRGRDAEALGLSLAEVLLRQGADEVVEEIRRSMA